MNRSNRTLALATVILAAAGGACCAVALAMDDHAPPTPESAPAPATTPAPAATPSVKPRVIVRPAVPRAQLKLGTGRPGGETSPKPIVLGKPSGNPTGAKEVAKEPAPSAERPHATPKEAPVAVREGHAVPAKAELPGAEHTPPAAKPPAPATLTNPFAPTTATAPGAPTTPTAPNTPTTPTNSGAVTQSTSNISADQALKLLIEGNARWIAGSPQNPNIEPARRADLAANGQQPFVTILTCADSRLPVERMFDRGVGEIFVARVAGNVVAPHEAGTIEYAAEHLQTPLLVVMGHTKCGAVKAAIAGGHASPNIESLLKDIKPAIERAKALNPDENDDAVFAASVRENVWESIYDLIRTSPATRSLVEQKKLKVVGAVCDISTGKVMFMGEHPWQTQLVQAMSNSKSNNEATAAAEEK